MCILEICYTKLKSYQDRQSFFYYVGIQQRELRQIYSFHKATNTWEHSTIHMFLEHPNLYLHIGLISTSLS